MPQSIVESVSADSSGSMFIRGLTVTISVNRTALFARQMASQTEVALVQFANIKVLKQTAAFISSGFLWYATARPIVYCVFGLMNVILYLSHFWQQ